VPTHHGPSGCLLGAIRQTPAHPVSVPSKSSNSLRPTRHTVAPASLSAPATAAPVFPPAPTTATRRGRGSAAGCAAIQLSVKPVPGGAVGPAAEPGVSRPPVEERLGRALRDRLLPVGPGGLGVVAEVVTVDRPGQHHAVVVQRGPLGDLVPQHVADHELRITFQWVAPPAAAGGADPDRLAGPYRLGVG